MVADKAEDSIKQQKHMEILDSTRSVVKTALEKLCYSNYIYELLTVPIRLMTVLITVRMNEGSIKVFTGYRGQHNDAVGPTKGGVRFHPEVTETEVKALSIWMSLKAGIVDLP